ncbi:XkdF-like putative serine protease domain-containing protein [Eubacterium sp.]|uniref:XkdF-like putative serine protease domain-containing protein n=1 Tax=Eubacterium sp. TaxID=142586 RepID=UPI002FC98B95
MNVNLTIPISKVSEDDHVVYGVVYKASKEFGEDGKPVDNVDTDGNWMSEGTVKKACHNFNRKLQKPKISKGTGVDKQHNEVADYGTVLESYIAKAAVEDINAEPGDWVAAIEVTDGPTWEEVLKGQITGFSIGGTAVINQEGGSDGN